MGADRNQWQFPKNEVGKVIGWSDEASPSNPSASKGLVNKGPFATPADLDTKQDASANLTTLAGITPGTAGQAILAHSLQADVRNYLDVAPYVATRTALKALDTTKDTVAYLTELGFERKYIWRTGDYSAEVAADPVGEKYLKADAIAAASGAWVWEHVDRNDWHPLAGGATIVEDSEHGHSWALGGIVNEATGETTVFRTKGYRHSTTNGLGIYRSISKDYGLTCKDERDLEVDLDYDTRFLAYGVINGTYRLFTRGTDDSDGTNMKYLHMSSTDYFKTNVTKTAITLTSGGVAPHGNLFSLPASLGSHGSDTAGQVVYGYGGNNIRCWHTDDDWATHTEVLDLVTAASVGKTTLSEPWVVECGAPNRRIGFFRVDTPDDDNLYCFNMTTGIAATGVTDTGRYNGGTPPYARWEERTDRVYVYRVNRPFTGDFDENFPANALLMTWEDADWLISDGTIRREWTVAYILPDFLTGYFYEVPVGDKIMVVGTCGESNPEGSVEWQTSAHSFTKKVLIGSVSVATGAQPRINRNLCRNPQFQHWFNGTSFTHSDLAISTSPATNGKQTAEGLFIAVNAGVTGTVQRSGVAAYVAELIPGGPEYGVQIQLSAGDGSSDQQLLMWRFRNAFRWAGRLITVRLYCTGTAPTTAVLDAFISYAGTAYVENATNVPMTGPCSGADSNGIFILSGTVRVPELDGVTPVTSSSLMEIRVTTTFEETAYTIWSMKIEEGPDATAIIGATSEESERACLAEREVLVGGVDLPICEGKATTTALFRGTLGYGPKNSDPTITAVGTASHFEVSGASGDHGLGALPTFTVARPSRAQANGAVSGSAATAATPYTLRFTGDATSADKIVIETGF